MVSKIQQTIMHFNLKNKTFPLIALILIVFTACTDRATKQAEEDETLIQDYIADNNLDAIPSGTGLYYVIEEEGTGLSPTLFSTVMVNYSGNLIDGTVFDANDSISFGLSSVIQGWQEGIPYFKEGGSGKLLIPSALGYGSQSVGSIPRNSVLIFDIDLLKVE